MYTLSTYFNQQFLWLAFTQFITGASSVLFTILLLKSVSSFGNQGSLNFRVIEVHLVTFYNILAFSTGYFSIYCENDLFQDICSMHCPGDKLTRSV